MRQNIDITCKKNYTEGQKNRHNSAIKKKVLERFAAKQTLDNWGHDAV